MKRLYQGRRIILTSCLPLNMQPKGFIGSTLNQKTLVAELNRALRIHQENKQDIVGLKEIYKNKQQIYERASNEEDRLVNNMVAVAYPSAFTRQIVGYTYPSGIQFVPLTEKCRPDVEKLNRFMKSEDKTAVDKIMETEQSIIGTHYRAILPDATEANECPFEILPLNAENTFVAYSTYNRRKPVYSYHSFMVEEAPDGPQKFIHQVYTGNVCFIYKSDSEFSVQQSDFVSAAPHILGNVPIVEYPNNEFRLGDWELGIDLFNAINAMTSDGLNDVQQAVLCYLVLLGVRAPTEEEAKLMKKNKMLAFENPNGVNQDAKFITAQLDGQSAELFRTYLENAIHTVVGIPDRNSSGGGDTGEAINAKNGWREIDTVAKNKAMFTEASERKLLRVALQILKPKHISESLSVLDVDIKIARNKDDNIQTKTQAGSTLYSMGVAKTDIATTMDISTDIEGFVKRWEEAEQKKQADANKKPQDKVPIAENIA